MVCYEPSWPEGTANSFKSTACLAITSIDLAADCTRASRSSDRRAGQVGGPQRRHRCTFDLTGGSRTRRRRFLPAFLSNCKLPSIGMHCSVSAEAHDASTRAAQAEAPAAGRGCPGRPWQVTDAHQGPRATSCAAFIDSRLVVVASRAPAIPLGSVITAIDGVSANDRFAAAMDVVSGTIQWRQYRAAQEILACTNATARLSIDEGVTTQTVDVPCGVAPPPAETRPLPITELVSGIWYVDLTRARSADLKLQIDGLALARGVIFDVRGYPTDAGGGCCRTTDTLETDC